MLLGLLWARIGGLPGAELLGFTARVGLASLVMMVVLAATLRLLAPLAGAGVGGLSLLLGLGVAVGIGVFALATVVLRLPEARQVWEMALARVRSGVGRGQGAGG